MRTDLPEDAARLLDARQAAAAAGRLVLCSYEGFNACDELAIYRFRPAAGGDWRFACINHVEEILAETITTSPSMIVQRVPRP